MFRTALAALLAACTLLAQDPTAWGDPGDETLRSGQLDLWVNGLQVETWGLTVLEDGQITAPLRPVAEALGADCVFWDAEDRSITVWGEGLELYVPLGAHYMDANGRYFYIPQGVALREGRCVLPLDYIAAVFGADLVYDPALARVDVTTAGGPITPGDRWYDGEDVYWLSRIIQAEAGGEPFEGKIAVGNVVMARVASEEYPDTVEGVIFDKRYGVQFTPAYSGSVYNTPSQESVIAAKLALEGVCVAPGATFFASQRAAENCYASRHFAVVAEIGGHVFFG